MIRVRRRGALRRELLAQLGRIEVDAALLDLQGPDALVVDPGAQRLLLVGQLFQHFVRRGQCCRDVRRGGDVGDARVQQPPVDRSGDRGDQTGADDCTIGLVDVLTDRTAVSLRCVADTRATRQQRGPSRCAAVQLTGPERGLLDLTGVTDPLRFHALGDRVVRDARRHLDARCPLQKLGDEGPRRRVGVVVEHAPSISPARGVGENHVVRREVGGLGFADQYVAGQAQCGQVGAGGGRCLWIAFDTSHTQSGARGADEVAADPTSQVDHAGARQGGCEACGSVGARLWFGWLAPGRLG